MWMLEEVAVWCDDTGGEEWKGKYRCLKYTPVTWVSCCTDSTCMCEIYFMYPRRGS